MGSSSDELFSVLKSQLRPTLSHIADYRKVLCDEHLLARLRRMMAAVSAPDGGTLVFNVSLWDKILEHLERLHDFTLPLVVDLREARPATHAAILLALIEFFASVDMRRVPHRRVAHLRNATDVAPLREVSPQEAAARLVRLGRGVRRLPLWTTLGAEHADAITLALLRCLRRYTTLPEVRAEIGEIEEQRGGLGL